MSLLFPRLAATLLAAIVLALPLAPAAAFAANCSYVQGATLYGSIPDVVGMCLADQTTDPRTGDAIQPTEGGLLVWRKVDNLTVFTDGAHTWLQGPFGLEERANDERLWWEPNPDQLGIVPIPSPGDACHTAGLAVELQGVDAGAGNLVGTFLLRNTSGAACVTQGYVGTELRDADSNPLPTVPQWGGGWFSRDPAPMLVRIEPGAAAWFRLHWEQVEVGNERTCPVAGAVAITPPDEYTPIVVRTGIRACGGGRLDVGAVRSGQQTP